MDDSPFGTPTLWRVATPERRSREIAMMSAPKTPASIASRGSFLEILLLIRRPGGERLSSGLQLRADSLIAWEPDPCASCADRFMPPVEL
jgi:hypothetical protein